jgi:hypothetical protein
MLAIAFVVMINLSVSIAQTSTTKPIAPKPSDMGADKGSNSTDEQRPLTTFEEEIRAKRLIKLAEKEHEENLKRAREISQLGKDLKLVLANRSSLDREDNKKLDRLEKLTKKIRGEAGGDDQDVRIANAPADIASTATQIADAAEQLSKDVQKTPRQVVSAAVIDRANVLLQLVKTLRGFTRRYEQ